MIIDYMMGFQFTSFLALFIYWIPLAVCLAVYFFRAISFYKNDLRGCEKNYYIAQLTIGIIIWWIICAAMPAGNLFALVFDCASSVFKWLGSVFDMPLVRHRPVKEKQ